MRPTHLLFLSLALAAGGCSAVINPDLTRLGDTDAGGGGVDLGGPGPDAGDVDLGGGVDLGQPDLGTMPCTDGTPAVCSGSVLSTCVSGMTMNHVCPLGCSSEDATRCAEILPANVGDVVTRAAGDLDVTADVRFDTDTCIGGSGVHAETLHPGGAPPLCVLAANTVRVRAGTTVHVVGRAALAIVSAGELRIEGDIDVSAHGAEPGPGGALGGRVQPGAVGVTAVPAEGLGAGADGENASTYDDGGGGGGSFCGQGADGGDGGTAAGGAGGFTFDPTDLTPLIGGSGGGRGRGRLTMTGLGNSGPGGAGGGAVQLVAYGTLRLEGRIFASGGGGGGGGNDTMLINANMGSGGGGGSGGGVLIEAAAIEVGGAASVDVSGAGGGGGASTPAPGGHGGDGAGGNGVGGTSGGDPYGSVGGAGAGAISGADGMTGGTNAGTSANGGGGGGGGGCVIVHVPGGVSPPALSAGVAPLGASPVLTVRSIRVH